MCTDQVRIKGSGTDRVGVCTHPSVHPSVLWAPGLSDTLMMARDVLACPAPDRARSLAGSWAEADEMRGDHTLPPP